MCVIIAVLSAILLTTKPSDIHRLGRTARAGKAGSGLLILAPWEQRFLAHKDMHTVPITEATMSGEAATQALIPYRDNINKAMLNVDDKVRCTAYQVCLFLGPKTHR